MLDGLGNEFGQVRLDTFEQLNAAQAGRELFGVPNDFLVRGGILDRHGCLICHGMQQINVFSTVEVAGFLVPYRKQPRYVSLIRERDGHADRHGREPL